jgi:hypothetical protein
VMQIKRSLVRDCLREMVNFYESEDYDAPIVQCVINDLRRALDIEEVSFTCEHCRQKCAAFPSEEGDITCPACDHTVDVGVYVVVGES